MNVKGYSKGEVYLHETHSLIARPTLAVVVPDDVLIVGVRVLREVPLDQVPRFLSAESEEHVDLVHISRVETDRVAHFRGRVSEGQVLRSVKKAFSIAREKV